MAGCHVQCSDDVGSRVQGLPNEQRFFEGSDGNTPPWEQRGLIDSAVRSAMRRWAVPGVSVSVVDDGRLVWAGSYGWKKSGSDDPVRLDTPFQASSLSKPIAAAVALTLVADGSLDLDLPVSSYLDSWPLLGPVDDGVTLRRLLSHTSGLGVDAFAGYPSDGTPPELREILLGEGGANHGPIKVKTNPGLGYLHSGGGYVLLQYLVSKVSGSSFEREARGRLLNPVGMKNSSFGGVPEDASAGHRADGVPVEGGPRVHPELAAAGLWTTAVDLARFVLFLQSQKGSYEGHRIIPRDLIEEMMSPVIELPDSPGRYMGLGFVLQPCGEEGAWFRYAGANVGFRALMVGEAHGGRAAVILTNGDNGERLATEVLEVIATAFAWPPCEDEHSGQ